MNRSDALKGKRILVVEDEAFFAFYLADTIQDAGGTVIGPFAGVAETLNVLDGPQDGIDAATLDIRLRDEQCYHVADRLSDRRTPLVFISGTLDELPTRYDHRPTLQKPVAAYQIVEVLAALIDGISS